MILGMINTEVNVIEVRCG